MAGARPSSGASSIRQLWTLLTDRLAHRRRPSYVWAKHAFGQPCVTVWTRCQSGAGLVLVTASILVFSTHSDPPFLPRVSTIINIYIYMYMYMYICMLICSAGIPQAGQVMRVIKFCLAQKIFKAWKPHHAKHLFSTWPLSPIVLKARSIAKDIIFRL